MRIGISVKMREGGYDRFGDEKYTKIKSYGFDCVDFDMCNILTKDSYTKFLLKKCKTFDDFESLYKSNNKIYNLILNNKSKIYASISSM